LTLNKLQKNLNFSAGTQVKITRRAVGSTIMLTRWFSRSNTSLRWMFAMAAHKLPLTPLSQEWSAGAQAHSV
jgi:farnesyl-diphosphate farnesyltransferase